MSSDTADVIEQHAATPTRTGQPLFGQGLFGEHLTDAADGIRAVLTDVVRPWAHEAERAGRFPRQVLAGLAAAGVIARRWPAGCDGDTGWGALLAIESGRLGFAGLSVGISLQVETVASILHRYGRTELLRGYLDGVRDGRLVGCLGASEAGGGSDLMSVSTTATRILDGWQVRGEKKFLSLGRVADFALLLCRMDGDGAGGLGVVAVPAAALTVRKRLVKTGTQSLDTTWMDVACTVGEDAVVARPGLGLLAVTYGLTYERLSVAGQVVGCCEYAIDLAVSHLHNRRQFGRPLFECQALRIRIAELASRLTVLRHAVLAMAAGLFAPGGPGVREVAALKVTAARFAEECTSECMHVFGGAGYLEDETPLSRMWRDSRLARIGGGTDEMMWELVAGGLGGDGETYRAAVSLR
ncbi:MULTISPECIES: acyl-CoA dehydrogenase family protein [unclassified Frankia]|uniref:acyl-CoA dehydrogenase family protein n=1 Tax=unclassified Frankia TaxID=2632575 RepID=UPI001EF5DA0B|nr:MULTISPECIES: acyl-CoA dehydrogenase family protein [unclassified Frankia]